MKQNEKACAPSGAGGQTAEKKLGLGYLLQFAGSRKPLLYLGCVLSAVSMLLGFGPYICIWLVARNLIAAAPDWSAAANLATY